MCCIACLVEELRASRVNTWSVDRKRTVCLMEIHGVFGIKQCLFISPSPFTMPCWWRLTGEPCNLWQAYKKECVSKQKFAHYLFLFRAGYTENTDFAEKE